MGRRAAAIKQERLAPDDTRTRLLTAAVEVFAENGYEGTTIRKICGRAGANVALVNYHFGDKMELYLEVIRYAIDASAKTKIINKAIEENPDPCDALRQIIRGVIDRFNETSSRYGKQFGLPLRLLVKETTQPTPAFARVINETLRPLYDRLRSLIAQISGLSADHETTRLCTHSVMGQVAHYAMARPLLEHLWPEMQMTPGQRRMVADHIADFSLAYLRAQRAKGSAPSISVAAKRRPR
jgi:TetR/AcrR family transcriptional regulator, regulator of cefoperazone and chloramphenicol sensitivity